MKYGKLRTNTDCHEWCRIVSVANPASSPCMCDLGIRENPSTISSLVLLLGLISWFPKDELRVATNAPKRLRIDYDSVAMSKNALGIWYESRTIFRIGEFVAKVLNSSKLLSRIPDRPTNCKNSLRFSTIQPRIQIFVNSCQFVAFGACVEKGYKILYYSTCNVSIEWA